MARFRRRRWRRIRYKTGASRLYRRRIGRL